MYLIDTNILAFFIKQNIKVLELFERHKDKIHFCVVVQMECEYGALKNESTKLMTFYNSMFDNYKYVSMAKKEAHIFAKIKNDFRKKGITVEDFDLMIAAQAIANNLTLITNNTKHFENIDELKIEDWTV